MPRLAFASASRPGRAAALNFILRAARTAWTMIQRELRLRATIRTLHELDDRSLRDIGLQREDIERAVRDRCRNR